MPETRFTIGKKYLPSTFHYLLQNGEFYRMEQWYRGCEYPDFQRCATMRNNHRTELKRLFYYCARVRNGVFVPAPITSKFNECVDQVEAGRVDQRFQSRRFVPTSTPVRGDQVFELEREYVRQLAEADREGGGDG